MKPAGYSDLKAATCSFESGHHSDLKAAGVDLPAGKTRAMSGAGRRAKCDQAAVPTRGVIGWLNRGQSRTAFDRNELVEIEIDDGLKRVAGGAVADGLGKRVEPGEVFGPQNDEVGDGVAPALGPAAAIDRPAVSDDRCAGMARPVARLALGACERLITDWLATAWHRLLL
jgi:hypothetical protein